MTSAGGRAVIVSTHKHSTNISSVTFNDENSEHCAPLVDAVVWEVQGGGEICGSVLDVLTSIIIVEISLTRCVQWRSGGGGGSGARAVIG